MYKNIELNLVGRVNRKDFILGFLKYSLLSMVFYTLMLFTTFMAFESNFSTEKAFFDLFEKHLLFINTVLKNFSFVLYSFITVCVLNIEFNVHRLLIKIGYLVAFVFSIVIFNGIELKSYSLRDMLISFIMFLPLFYFKLKMISLMVKRIHDFNYKASYFMFCVSLNSLSIMFLNDFLNNLNRAGILIVGSLLLYISAFSVLVIMLMMLFRKGTQGENQFGLQL